MEHCINHVNLKQVITARSFYDRISQLLPQTVKEKCIFFEEKVKGAPLSVKVAGFASFALKRAPRTQPDDVAVVLFTSGSEALPKAVELTHKNILYDLHGSFSHLSINTDHILPRFSAPLPQFRVYDFDGFYPLVTAVKIAYTPDSDRQPGGPEDFAALPGQYPAGNDRPSWKMILAVATGNDLKQVRLGISGAESLHPSVRETFFQKTGGKAPLVEGYGITECSPVLAINPLELQKEKSVGTFIKGVDFLITDINTYEPLPQGKGRHDNGKGQQYF